MPLVHALYRYPVKGFTPESVNELVVQDDGRIAGDRVLAFRFANAAEPESRDGQDYWPKSKGLALMTFPSLARLRLRFDHDDLRVQIRDGDDVIADEHLNEAGRRHLEDAVTAFVASSPDAALLAEDGVLRTDCRNISYS